MGLRIGLVRTVYFSLGFVLSLWLSVMPTYVQDDYLSGVGNFIGASIYLITMGLFLGLNVKMAKFMYYVVLVAFVLGTWILFYTPMDILVMVQNVLLAILTSGFAKKACLAKQGQENDWAFGFLGFMLASGLVIVDLDPSFYFLGITIGMLPMIGAFNMIQDNVDIPSNHAVKINFWYLHSMLMFGMLQLVLISFLIWSSLLIDDSQDVFMRAQLFFMCAFLFMFRSYGRQFLLKYSDNGWTFIFALILMFTMGLFYVSGIPFLFSIGFSFSISAIWAAKPFGFPFVMTRTVLAYAVLVFGLVTLFFSFYVDAHIDFIKAIELPEEVLNLSARQAIMKELTFICAILVLSTGLVFLNRRKLNAIQ